MRFLLNKKIEVYSVNLVEREGSFDTKKQKIGEFFASIKIINTAFEKILNIVLRKAQDMPENIEVYFEEEQFMVQEITEINKNFIKIVCMKKKNHV